MATLVGLFKTAIASVTNPNGSLNSRPRIVFGALTYKVSMDGRRIFVSTGKYPDSVFYGAINLVDGLFYPKASAPKAIVDEVIEHMSHPTASMIKAGRATGYCCICGRGLVNKTSVKYMIGPICAGRWGIDLESIAVEDAKKEQQSIWDEL